MRVATMLLFMFSPSIPTFPQAKPIEYALAERCEPAALFKPVYQERGGALLYQENYRWVERCTFLEAVCFISEEGMSCVPRIAK